MEEHSKMAAQTLPLGLAFRHEGDPTQRGPDTKGPVTWLPNPLGSGLVRPVWCGKHLLVLSVQCMHYFIISAF
jgi:hypothetical protein